MYSIYSDFDHNPSLEVRGIFCDISKAFDKVWHKVILYKVEALGIPENLLKLIQSFCSDRHQRVALNGQHSKWAQILACRALSKHFWWPLFFIKDWVLWL